MRARFLLLLVVVVAAFVLAPPAAAQEPVTDDDVNEVAKDLFCPVCENTPLDTCPTQACIDWREEIRAQLEAGRTEAEIQQYFVDRYGPRVLSSPPREGFNLIVWLLPSPSSLPASSSSRAICAACDRSRLERRPTVRLAWPRAARRSPRRLPARMITYRGLKRNCGNERNDLKPV